jgi:type IIG restriction enzyme and methyltransferase
LPENIQKIYKESIFHKYALGGRVNLFQYFYPLGINITKNNGIITFITQNSLLAEESAINNRKYIFNSSKILKIDSFPERDNKEKRVFKSAKMSVCICFLKKEISEKSSLFTLNIWQDKEMINKRSIILSKDKIYSIFGNDMIIPICDEKSFKILYKIRNSNSFFINSNAGEVDMTRYKKDFSKDTRLYRVITGAQILKYRLTSTPSQGEIIYIDKNKLKLSDNRKEDINGKRIVLQRITGVDSKIRIIATLVEGGYLCANSTNYISVYRNNIDIYFLLGVLNSSTINFFFKLTSTNTNVTGKELDRLPIPIIKKKEQQPIITLVEQILKLKNENPKADITNIESQIDILVYKLYNLTYEEVKVIDPNIENIISKEEYETKK